MRRWALVLLLLVGSLGGVSPAEAQVRDAEPACADITALDASMWRANELLVTLSLAAPSCPWVSYQVGVFARPDAPEPVFVSTQRKVSGQTRISYRLATPSSVDQAYVAATTNTFLLQVSGSLLPPLIIGARQLDREPDVGAVQALRVNDADPRFEASLSFD